MNFFDRARELMGLGAEIGDKIIELDAQDIAEKEMLDSRVKATEKEIERHALNLKDLKFDHEKWWIKMRRKYNLSSENLHYSDGAFWKWKS